MCPDPAPLENQPPPHLFLFISPYLPCSLSISLNSLVALSGSKLVSPEFKALPPVAARRWLHSGSLAGASGRGEAKVTAGWVVAGAGGRVGSAGPPRAGELQGERRVRRRRAGGWWWEVADDRDGGARARRWRGWTTEQRRTCGYLKEGEKKSIHEEE